MSGPVHPQRFNQQQRSAIGAALLDDKVVDIVTTGGRTGVPRRVEIWFHNIDGRIIICGLPRPRGWLANLRKHPDLLFCFKESLRLELPARASEVIDPGDRYFIMSAPQTSWYRSKEPSVDVLVRESPIVQVFLDCLD